MVPFWINPVVTPTGIGMDGLPMGLVMVVVAAMVATFTILLWAIAHREDRFRVVACPSRGVPATVLFRMTECRVRVAVVRCSLLDGEPIHCNRSCLVA